MVGVPRLHHATGSAVRLVLCSGDQVTHLRVLERLPSFFVSHAPIGSCLPATVSHVFSIDNDRQKDRMACLRSAGGSLRAYVRGAEVAFLAFSVKTHFGCGGVAESWYINGYINECVLCYHNKKV